MLSSFYCAKSQLNTISPFLRQTRLLHSDSFLAALTTRRSNSLGVVSHRRRRVSLLLFTTAPTGVGLDGRSAGSVYVTLSVRAKVRRFCSRAATQVFRGSYLLVYAGQTVPFLPVYVSFYLFFSVLFLCFAKSVGKPTLCVVLMVLLLLLLLILFDVLFLVCLCSFCSSDPSQLFL